MESLHQLPQQPVPCGSQWILFFLHAHRHLFSFPGLWDIWPITLLQWLPILFPTTRDQKWIKWSNLEKRAPPSESPHRYSCLKAHRREPSQQFPQAQPLSYLLLHSAYVVLFLSHQQEDIALWMFPACRGEALQNYAEKISIKQITGSTLVWQTQASARLVQQLIGPS